MPDWNVTGPDGQTLTISGDEMPDEQALNDIFSHPDIKADPSIKDQMSQARKADIPSTLSQFFPAMGDLTPEQQENVQQTTGARKVMSAQGMSQADIAANADQISKKWDAIISQAQESRPENVAKFQQMKAAELRAAGSEPISSPKAELPKMSEQDVTSLTGIRGRAARNLATVQSQIAGAAESFLTPEGAAMGLPGAGTAFARAFIPQMIKSAAESVGKAVGHYSAGDKEAGDRELAAAAATSAMLVVPHVLGKGEPSTKGATDASKIQEATTVHGDVQSQPGESPGKVPAEEGGGGIQPQTTQETTGPEQPVSVDESVPEKIVSSAVFHKPSKMQFAGHFHPNALDSAFAQGAVPGVRSYEDLENLSEEEQQKVHNQFEHGYLTNKGNYIPKYGPGSERVQQLAEESGQLRRAPTGEGGAVDSDDLILESQYGPAKDIYDEEKTAKPDLEKSVETKLKTTPIATLLKFTPELFVNWKKMSKYGIGDAEKIADRVTDEDLPKVKAERDSLYKEINEAHAAHAGKYEEAASSLKKSGLTGEKYRDELSKLQQDFMDSEKPFMAKSLKAQTLNEIIQAKEAKAPEHITAATYTNPETARVTEGSNHIEAAAKQKVEAPAERSARETKEYGFKTNKGEVVSRAEAYKIAKKAGQVINDPETPSQFHSEHLRLPGEEQPAKPVPEMGGAAKGEIPESQGGEGIYGVSQKVLEARAAAGKTAPIEPGEGISGIKSVERGRDLLDAGYDVQKGVEDFERTGSVHPDTVMAARAHGERLAQAAQRIEETSGTDSPEYQAAIKAVGDWDQRIKPMATKLSRGFSALQGATEIDTGTYTGLQRAFYETTGKMFDPKQAAEAKQKVADVALKDEELDTALQDFSKGMQQELGIKETAPPVTPESKVEQQQELADGVDPQVQEKVQAEKASVADEAMKSAVEGEPETSQADTMWHVLNEFYLKKGIRDFDTIVDGLAEDFGMQREDVVNMLRGNKRLRQLSDDVWRKQQDARTVRQAAQRWLQDQQTPGWQRALAQVPRTMFVAKTGLHGTVGPVTHAGIHIFDPQSWSSYFPNAVRGYGMAWNKAYHERMVQDLVRDPNWQVARRGGLANDPFRFSDDYQSAAIRSWLGKLGGLTGNRGFDALKLIRQSLFNKTWDSLKPEERTARQAELLADSINHSTGTVKQRFPEAASALMFAPKLEASRWAWAIGDSLKSAKTFTNWKNSSPEERMSAMRDVRQKARMAGTYFAFLAVNQGLLSAMGSDQKINVTDPKKSDFLSFKAAGHKVGIIGPMIGIVRLLSNLYHDAAGHRTKAEKRFNRFEESSRDTLQYVRGKLSPFAGTVTDMTVAGGSDIFGRPLPFSDQRVPKRMREQGIGPYTWPEYATDKLAPIPFEDFVQDVWKRQGMSQKDIESYMKSLALAATVGTTGVRVTPDEQ